MGLGLHLGLRLGLRFKPWKNEMCTGGVAFGVAFCSVFFRFRPHKFPLFKRKMVIFAFFEGQNYMSVRFRGTLFGVKS